MTVNDNSIGMSQYRGEVSPCRWCKKEETLLGRVCGWCFGSGYTAVCLRCDGTGSETAGSIWDGGKSKHLSTCNICGGKGVLPAREVDYHPAQGAEPETREPHGIPSSTATPMVNLDLHRTDKAGI